MALVKRNLGNKINKLLDMFPAVAIIGVRQGGKTVLSQLCRPNWKYFDLENSDDYDRITRDTGFFFKENPSNIILDEAQKYPEIFNILRGIIDKERNAKGRFILTGSSSFELIKSISESLAGRVGIVELGTLKVNELFQKPLSDFYKIFDQKIDNSVFEFLKSLKTTLTNKNFKHVLLKGGYPKPVLSKNNTVHQYWMDNYFKTYINRDIRSLFPKLDIVKFRRFVSMLANLSGTIINKSELARSIEVSEGTIRDYIEIANGSFIWRIFYSFEKTVTKSIVKSPRGGLRDTGLLNYLLKISDVDDLDNYPFIGRIFESFICEEIIKGFEATMVTNWNYYYYRTKKGAEIDLILEGPFGVVPIEIKYGIKTRSKDLSSLSKFIEDNKLPLAILINNADDIEMLSEKVIQIPVRYL